MLPTILPAPPSRPADTPADDVDAYYRSSRRVYGSRFASVYDLVALPLHALRRRVARLAAIGPGMRVIDVATGTGAQARAFADAGAAVVGVDLSPRMLAIARRKTRNARVTFIEADATVLPAPDATFDAACISFALHEMPARVRARVIAELVRVTRPGGTIVVVDYGLPRSRIWGAVVERVVRLYERDHYAELVHANLAEALAAAGVAVHTDRRAVLGVARVIVGRR